MKRIFKTVGFIDSMIAAASFRDMVNITHFPQLSHTKANPKRP